AKTPALLTRPHFRRAPPEDDDQGKLKPGAIRGLCASSSANWGGQGFLAHPLTCTAGAARHQRADSGCPPAETNDSGRSRTGYGRASFAPAGIRPPAPPA